MFVLVKKAEFGPCPAEFRYYVAEDELKDVIENFLSFQLIDFRQKLVADRNRSRGSFKSSLR